MGKCYIPSILFIPHQEHVFLTLSNFLQAKYKQVGTAQNLMIISQAKSNQTDLMLETNKKTSLLRIIFLLTRSHNL